MSESLFEGLDPLVFSGGLDPDPVNLNLDLRGHVRADGGGEVTLREVVLHIQLTHLHIQLIIYFSTFS